MQYDNRGGELKERILIMIAVLFTHSLLSVYVNDITVAVLKKIYVSDDNIFDFYFAYDGV